MNPDPKYWGLSLFLAQKSARMTIWPLCLDLNSAMVSMPDEIRKITDWEFLLPLPFPKNVPRSSPLLLQSIQGYPTHILRKPFSVRWLFAGIFNLMGDLPEPAWWLNSDKGAHYREYGKLANRRAAELWSLREQAPACSLLRANWLPGIQHTPRFLSWWGSVPSSDGTY